MGLAIRSTRYRVPAKNRLRHVVVQNVPTAIDLQSGDFIIKPNSSRFFFFDNYSRALSHIHAFAPCTKDVASDRTSCDAKLFGDLVRGVLLVPEFNYFFDHVGLVGWLVRVGA
jgi:hypothetical protein